MPRLSSAMQRCRRPNAPRCSAQPRRVHAETLDQEDRRAVAATPRAVRDADAVVGDDLAHDMHAYGRFDVLEQAPTTASRIASAKRAAASGSSGSYGSAQRHERAEAHLPRTERGAERSAGRDRGGDDRRVRQRLQQRHAAGCPRRCATTWARAGRRRDGRRAGTTRMSGALALIAPSRRASPPSNGSCGRADDAQPAAPSRAHRDAERGRLDDAEAAVRDDAPPDRSRDVLAARRRRTRIAASNSGRHEIGELRVEAERIDRDSGRRARRSCSSASPSGRRGVGRSLVGVERRPRSPSTDRPSSVCVTRSCHRLAARRDRDDVGPLEQLAQHVLRRVRGRVRPSASTRAARRRRCGRGGSARRRAARSRRPRPRRRARPRPTSGRQHRAAARGRRGAPPATAWPRRARRRCSGPSKRCSIAATIASRGVVGMQQRERRIGERGHRHDRQAQQPAERARHVRADDRRVAQRAHRHAVAQARRPSPIASTSSSERPYGVRGAGTTSSSGTDAARVRRAVHLEPAAQHDVLELARARGGAQRRDRAQLGALDRRRRASSATRARTRRSARRRVGANSSTNSASRSRSRGSMRRNSARRRRRRGGTKSTPTTSVGPRRAARSAARRACRARRPSP